MMTRTIPVLAAAALAACAHVPARVVLTDAYGSIVYVAGEKSLAEFFQKRHVLVAPFKFLKKGESEPGEIQTLYPSSNLAGRSPMYSHIVKVLVPPDVPIVLSNLDPSKTMLVLESTSGDVYRLVGTVDKPPKHVWDFFEDKPEYHRRGR